MVPEVGLEPTRPVKCAGFESGFVCQFRHSGIRVSLSRLYKTNRERPHRCG